ncbi:AraC family transcriptional regulator [Streptomyces sp. G44]|uniref:AraC family transcriptional regulator n=1 Tax=Streptomyces sp. G44 TaxID=2807632 RepID=UPI0027DCEF80|nr:AraC family transcriptional regulator [Streptomyces sp. G44]
MAAERSAGRAEFSRFVTRDPDEARTALSQAFCDLRLSVTGPPRDFRTSMNMVEWGALAVGETGLGTAVRLQAAELGSYLVAWTLTGSFDLRQGRSVRTHVTPRQAAVYDPAADNFVDIGSAECRIISVTIDTPALHRQLEVLLGRPVTRRPRLAPTLDVSRGPGRSWANLAQWVLRERDVPHGLLRQPIFARRFEQALLEGLLLATDHPYRSLLDDPAPLTRPAAVKRVMDVVQERPAEPYDAARLAEIAQVGLRTLQEAFRKNLGMSPMAYVQEVRLQRVRQHLRVADPGTVTVTEVAYQWGFAHLGRFARRYRARFGEPPSQTLRAR